MSNLADVLERSLPIIDNKLYFYSNKFKPTFAAKSIGGLKILNFDSQFQYQGYNRDFGPLNIAYITLYCKEI